MHCRAKYLIRKQAYLNALKSENLPDIYEYWLQQIQAKCWKKYIQDAFGFFSDYHFFEIDQFQNQDSAD